tara:strand:+ start:5880 stop:6170 length:291 start_codon:yes stop_codon:yes gene_type:complete
MNTKANLQIGQAYIVDDKPMVLTEINYREKKDDEVPYFRFTDGRYGFGRTLGARKSDCEILDNLEVADGIDPQDILDRLRDSINSMVQFYITKGNK